MDSDASRTALMKQTPTRTVRWHRELQCDLQFNRNSQSENCTIRVVCTLHCRSRCIRRLLNGVELVYSISEVLVIQAILQTCSGVRFHTHLVVQKKDVYLSRKLAQPEGDQREHRSHVSRPSPNDVRMRSCPFWNRRIVLRSFCQSMKH
jgi:hypothetical protein